jgi:hypothetical protein
LDVRQQIAKFVAVGFNDWCPDSAYLAFPWRNGARPNIQETCPKTLEAVGPGVGGGPPEDRLLAAGKSDSVSSLMTLDIGHYR